MRQLPLAFLLSGMIAVPMCGWQAAAQETAQATESGQTSKGLWILGPILPEEWHLPAMISVRRRAGSAAP
jgi:hypothetical protein